MFEIVHKKAINRQYNLIDDRSGIVDVEKS